MKTFFLFCFCVFLGLFLLCGVVGIITQSRQTPRQQPVVVPVSQPKRPTIDKSPEMQAKREAFLQELMDKGIFRKVKTGKVYVGPLFHTLDFDAKQNFVDIAWSWSYDGSNRYEILLIADVKTNKNIGSFTAAHGLDLD